MTPATPDVTAARRRRWPTVVVAVIAALALVAGGLLGAAALIVKQAPQVATLSAAKPGTWSSVVLPAPAANGDGTPFTIFVKPGSSDKVMLFFGDGGLNWNGDTAIQPVTLASSVIGGGNFYSPNLPFYEVNSFGGILRTTAGNPFSDYTTVYIPTTTGDLGIGDAARTFTSESGEKSTAFFNGHNNTKAALAWVYGQAAQPGTVLVAGSGTGGLSAAIWLGDVADHYPSAALFQYSDSAYFAASAFPSVVDPVWGADFESRYGFAITRNPLKDAITFNSARYGSRLTTLVSQTLLDKTLAAFSASLDGGYYSPQAGSDWNYGLKSTLRTLIESPPGVSLFLTNVDADSRGETPHILASKDRYTSSEQDGVTLETWLSNAVNHGDTRSFGLGYLRQ
ncbi:hypothetical protein KPL76_04245 [Subtercola sp. PAMC28395]|uniref:hypothetical protein n=1 Tax=Subtercola sp. PAMC28395 TaxID=2846775 RepID=UPI001C0B873E|nr:hypothetical protein [Subtercola sp. PAMC28395]QWT24603.1 hypothetical protein KPL76_04245 [Subtercola sp. PAMC28395]